MDIPYLFFPEFFFNKLIIPGSNDNTVRVWNLLGKQRTCIVLNGSECSVFNPRTGPQPAHQSSISSVRFSYDSLYIVCASTDHTVRVWSIHDGAVVNVLMHHSPVQFAAFSPDNLLIVSATLEKGLAGLKLDSLHLRFLVVITQNQLVFEF